MGLTAAVYDITFQQGADFDRTWTWKDADGNAVDLTSYTARMKGRRTVDSADTLFSLTSEAGDIVLGDAAGSIQVLVDAATTAGWAWAEGMYDLELISSGGTVYRLLKGRCLLDQEVTR